MTSLFCPIRFRHDKGGQARVPVLPTPWQQCLPLYSGWLVRLWGARWLDAVNDFFHDFLGYFAADRALRIIYAALGESQGASAGAALGVQAVQDGLLLRWRQSSEIYSGQLRGGHCVVQ